MELEEFRQALAKAAPALHAWGCFVKDNVKQLAKGHQVTPQLISSRMKDHDSAIGKLARKSYVDPLLEMTDLVGVRAVCLLSPDIETLRRAVLGFDGWDAIISRNPDDEVARAPDQFGYQSLHFEIRPRQPINLDGTQVPTSTCCELQIRTLMQHTFAEVVHDNIYKNSWGTPSKAQRYVSSSSALIETADHLFCETVKLLERENCERGVLLDQLATLYDSKIHKSPNKDQKFNRIVLDSFQEWIPEDLSDQISLLLVRKQYITERIKSRVTLDSFWSQPVVLLAYWLVDYNSDVARCNWPFAKSEDALHLVFSDLGESYRQG